MRHENDSISGKEAIQIADDCINAARCWKYFGIKVIIDNISASAASSSTKVWNHSCDTTGIIVQNHLISNFDVLK